jgi:SET domain-containing protein
MAHHIKEVWVELRPSSRVLGEVGVFAVRDIPAGQKVCPVEEGEEVFLTHEEVAELSPELQEKISRFAAGRPGGYLMDASTDFNELGISYFFNHSCDGNLGFDDEGDFVAIRDIKKGEELFYDYGLLEARPEFAFECQCGAGVCRKRVTGSDSKDPAFRERHKHHMYPDLRVS